MPFYNNCPSKYLAFSDNVNNFRTDMGDELQKVTDHKLLKR